MIKLFDAQAGFGGAKPGQERIPSAEELTGHMKRLSIGRALVRTDFEDMDRNYMLSNELLYEACAKHKGLVACPTVLPASGGDVPGEVEQVEELIAKGAGAATIRPKKDAWSLAEWCSGKLMNALMERRVPVLCRYSSFTLEEIGVLAKSYPVLPIILYQAGYRDQRTLVALLQQFRNVHLVLGSPYSVHRGVELLVERVGVKQLLFGTGFPASDLMPGITVLMYAQISEEDKQLIGSGNLDRLIGGIRK